jgi:hypothetical protein
MKIYKHGNKLVVITKTMPGLDDGLCVFFKEVENGELLITQFYMYLFSSGEFSEQFVDTGETMEPEGNGMKKYKTDFDCKQTEFDTGAKRSDPTGKGRFDLIPLGPLQRVAQVYERGANKHGERNWEQGFPTARGIDSAIRHIYQHTYGMDDEDHLAQAVWNLLAVMHLEMQIDEGRLSENLDTLPRHYGKDDLDEYIEERAKENPEFPDMVKSRVNLAKAKAREIAESLANDIDFIEKLPKGKITKRELTDVDFLDDKEIEEALEQGRKDSGYNQHPNGGWRK